MVITIRLPGTDALTSIPAPVQNPRLRVVEGGYLDVYSTLDPDGVPISLSAPGHWVEAWIDEPGTGAITDRVRAPVPVEELHASDQINHSERGLQIIAGDPVRNSDGTYVVGYTDFSSETFTPGYLFDRTLTADEVIQKRNDLA